MKKLVIKKSILTMCLTIVLASCSSWQYEPKTYRITTKTMTCPANYVYNIYDDLCYNFKPYYDIKPISKPIDTKIKTTHLKRLKKAKKKAADVDCVKALNYCGVNNDKF